MNFCILPNITNINTIRLAEAISVPRIAGNEARVKILNYVPNQVIRFVAHYHYHSIIQFAADETIKTITMGTPTAWQLHPSGNLLYVKPIDGDATTNMTLITNKRMYLFELHAEYADDITDPHLSFITRFVYNDAKTGANLSSSAESSMSNFPDLTHPENYNFKYKVSGQKSAIEPLLIFDDGEFTYIKFKGVNTSLPAIFMVDNNQREHLINYKLTQGFVIIERVHDKFTLRKDEEVICIFNETYNPLGD